ncbi:MAG: hypothetical protein JW819_07110 [Candidatus Krumholzibacteriota bacterium]|nr:hypothetical protein [Candidatus Krumholzibacteriota bacterium]
MRRSGRMALLLLALAAPWPGGAAGAVHAPGGGEAAAGAPRRGVPDAPLPPRLRRELDRLAAAAGEPRRRLENAALLLLAEGWQADRLVLAGGRLDLRGARPRPLRLVSLRGEGPDPPWRAGETAADPGDLVEAGARWLDVMDRRGHPFAQVWFQAEGAGDSLAVTAVLVPGPSGPLGELRFTGTRRLSPAFLAGYAGLDRDTPVSGAAARRGRERLAATGWFEAVDEPLLGWDAVEGTVGVLYTVRERERSSRVTGVVGGGGGETSGALDLDLFSPFGGGRRWRLAGSWQGGDRSRLQVTLREPRLLGWNVDLELGFDRVQRDSTYLQQAFQLDARLPLPAGWEGVAGVGYERSLFEQLEAETSRRRHRFGVAWRSLAMGYHAERRLALTSDLLVKHSSLPGEAPRERQVELSGDAGWLQPLRPPWKLRLRGGGRFLLAGAGGFNAAELFALGGALSLRGWDEESFRGDQVAWGSVALALGDPLELSVFLDYGLGRWHRPGGGRVDFDGRGLGVELLAPGARGRLSIAVAAGEASALSDLRLHLRLEAEF